MARGTSDGGVATCKIKNKIWLHTKLQTNAVVLLSENLQIKRQSIDCLFICKFSDNSTTAFVCNFVCSHILFLILQVATPPSLVPRATSPQWEAFYFPPHSVRLLLRGAIDTVD